MSHITQSDVPIVGISAGGEQSLEALSKLVVALRIKTPAKAIFVSGQIVAEARDAVELIGVDGMLDDIDTAKALMSSIWDALNPSI